MPVPLGPRRPRLPIPPHSARLYHGALVPRRPSVRRNRTATGRGPVAPETAEMVGATGLDPAPPWPRTKCATRLRYAPMLPRRRTSGLPALLPDELHENT